MANKISPELVARMKKLYPGTWHEFPSCWVGECVVTPDTCLEVLTKYNTHNRPKVPYQIDVISRALNLSGFLFTGETIIYDDHGILLNGQNRHQAGLETEKSFHTLVVFGVDQEAFKVLDQHARRTVGHVLAMMDIKYANATASALTNIYLLGKTGSLKSQGKLVITVEEKLEILRRHPDLSDYGRAVNFRKGGRIDIKSPGMLMFLYYLFASYDSITADQFFQELAGVRAMPERGGRNTLDKLKQQLKANMLSETKLPVEHLAALVIKTWNFIMAGVDREILQWKHRGGEQFPMPWGWHRENEQLVFRRQDP